MYASPAAFLEVDERTIEWLVSAKLCTIKDVLDFAYRHAKLRTFRFCLQQWERTPARPMDQLGQASLSWPKGSLFAVDADWTEFVNILVSKGFAINEDALAGACGKTEVFKVLLERRRALVPASQEDSSVLTAVIPSAIDWKNMTVLKLLLDYGADVNGIRRQAGRNASVDPPASPLECAVGAGAWDFVEFLLERKASVKSSTLMEATIRRASSDGGNPEWAVKFLDKGAPLNWRTMTDAMGCSPEMFRAVATHRTGRRLLQKKGVQSRVVGIAATVGNVDALELLRTELGIDLREYKAAIIGQAREHLAVVTQYLASVGV
ncbi:uncharacterized protein EV422DRAFT_508004 [Fimicolochytrium jonesii]|uniref:uncharacterized protein n=1 Tax=Fimicolochytrium jonesii TaxID=1396493 RepID=UPI0022FE79CE|nr:uncharacterized protein EV422DRAFT_508004 [Fimicolochytrium jonesii]KAI8818461.1 hypothetical protein EV422DRAFT_508004 [Fimicolochytrium jonesii]